MGARVPVHEGAVVRALKESPGGWQDHVPAEIWKAAKCI